ncbi:MULTISPECIES: AAA family ATPase [unclassified Pseudomonas]|uniref:AAA family ATPase n=1 Tax=unclassified Pseudomonas TaxID=196821 RepID=UPI000A1F8BCA|nr:MULTISPECIES: AAA family ATPase [unclassified Pseudomonas]
MKNVRVVITGGPGAGKSSLIEALGERNFSYTIEAGRQIIKDQTTIGGNATPWIDSKLFSELMLCWEIRSWHAAEGGKQPFFFDRGIPDIAGYLRFCGLPVPEHVKNSIKNFKYSDTVFIIPPWESIYKQDAERKQSFKEASLTFNAMVDIYQEYGYTLVEVPPMSVQERADFVLSKLNTASASD